MWINRASILVTCSNNSPAKCSTDDITPSNYMRTNSIVLLSILIFSLLVFVKHSCFDLELFRTWLTKSACFKYSIDSAETNLIIFYTAFLEFALHSREFGKKICRWKYRLATERLNDIEQKSLLQTHAFLISHYFIWKYNWWIFSFSTATL